MPDDRKTVYAAFRAGFNAGRAAAARTVPIWYQSGVMSVMAPLSDDEIDKIIQQDTCKPPVRKPTPYQDPDNAPR